MATLTTKPPRLFGVVSNSACTASSWSLASGGSIVTSGTCRQSSRPERAAGLAASASCCVSRGNTVRVNGDDADGALALQRSQSFNHAAGRQSETWRAGGFDRDQVSLLGIG